MYNNLLRVLWFAITVLYSPLVASDPIKSRDRDYAHALKNVRSWVDFRDENITKQEYDYSCGAASMSTILKYYFGLDSNEKSILEKISEIHKETGKDTDIAASFENLKLVAEKYYGFKAIGVSLSYKSLLELKIPAIVFINYWEQPHFTVLKATHPTRGIWLADSALGNIHFEESRFRSMWATDELDNQKGKALILIPKEESNIKIKINTEFFGNQKKTVDSSEFLFHRNSYR